MISVSEARAKFAELLAADPSWSSLSESQLADHLAVFCAWALRDAQFKTERALQEYFLSTAINKSSIQAHAEDREYLPIKAKPSSGSILITNSGTTSIAIPKNTEFVTSTGINIATTESSVVPASGSVSIPAEQKTAGKYEFDVTESIEFFECLLSRDISPSIASFSVSVTDNLAITETWKYYRLLQNTSSDTKAYDEFYWHTGQTGIRFGNGNFGKILEVGNKVSINTWETSGNVFISSGQQIFPVNSLSSTDTLKMVVSSAFTGGRDAESIESVRKNLHYWQTYNEDLIWSDDYEYFLRRKFPQLLFVNAWGEQAMEEQAGAPDFDFVNKIFFSVYSVGDDLTDACLSALLINSPLNRKFEGIAVNHVQWTIAIIGTVLDDISLTDAENAIRAVLESAYGKDSENRRDNVYTSEIYDLIMSTGYFESNTGARFSLTTSGSSTPSQLQDMVSIDLESSTISLSYIS